MVSNIFVILLLCVGLVFLVVYLDNEKDDKEGYSQDNTLPFQNASILMTPSGDVVVGWTGAPNTDYVYNLSNGDKTLLDGKAHSDYTGLFSDMISKDKADDDGLKLGQVYQINAVGTVGGQLGYAQAKTKMVKSGGGM